MSPETSTDHKSDGLINDAAPVEATAVEARDDTLPEAKDVVADDAELDDAAKDADNEDTVEIETPSWLARNWRKLGAWAAGFALAGTGVGVGAAWANHANANNSPGSVPSATGPAIPGPVTTPLQTSVATPTANSRETGEPSVEPSSSTTPSPSETETSTADTLPFDSDAVAEMKPQESEPFYQNPEPLRIMYYLSDAYDQETSLGTYGDFLDQQFTNGRTASEYNPFSSAGLNEKSDAQDIMNSYAYNQANVMAQEDPEQAKKLISGFVRDPRSKAYQDVAFLAEQFPNTKMDEKSINDVRYHATDQKLSKEVNAKTGKKETHISIETKGGYIFDFVFVPVENLSTLNADETDDSKVAGLWLLVSSKKM